MKKCEESYSNSDEFKKTICDAYEDFEELKKHGIEEGYVSQLYTLFNKYQTILIKKEECTCL